jgi:hypothetical protein
VREKISGFGFMLVEVVIVSVPILKREKGRREMLHRKCGEK